MKYSRSYQFSADPVMLPEEVLEEIAAEVMNYHGSGRSVLELGAEDALARQLTDQAQAALRKLLSVPDTHTVVFAADADAFAALPSARDCSAQLLTAPLELTADSVVFARLSRCLGTVGIAAAILPRTLSVEAPAPTCWAVYCCGKVLRCLAKQGDQTALAERCREHAALLRDFLRKSACFTLDEAASSPLAVCFSAASGENAAVSAAAADARLLLPVTDRGLEVTLSAALPREAVEALVDFLRKYEASHR